MSPSRRSSRRSAAAAAAAAAKGGDVQSRSKVEDDGDKEVYHFQGVDYTSYQGMVNAKRQRNQDVLERSGLLTAVQDVKISHKAKAVTAKRGLQKRKSEKKTAAVLDDPTKRRKSNRLQGIRSDGLFVEDERAGNFIVKGGTAGAVDGTTNGTEPAEQEEEHYRGRVNDGSALSIQEAVELAGPKWVQPDSVALATHFVAETLAATTTAASRTANKNKKKSSPTSVALSSTIPTADSPTRRTMVDETLVNAVAALSVENENCVAKVCPERIYNIAVHHHHPSCNASLVVAAGDKKGHVGIWNVDGNGSNNSSSNVHLFRPHTGATSCLQWTTDTTGLISASYDGSVRWFDVAAQSFEQIFATYDDAPSHRNQLGFGLDTDTGQKHWTQYACLDHRSNNSKCLFLSTSVGTAMHVDLRIGKGQVTFHEELSEKKINTLSLHPNGYSLISAGLDCTVNLWDLRNLGDSRNGRSSSSGTKAPKPIAQYNGGRSVNSAFFSPSGQYVVSTTMANKLDLFENLHQVGGGSSPNTSTMIAKPYKSISHDNMTGRWLTTFHAVWHPQLDVFGVGSMRKPRCMELFSPVNGECLRAVSGDALTAVTSRVAFSSSSDELVFVGGNSSGRVTVARSLK